MCMNTLDMLELASIPCCSTIYVLGTRTKRSLISFEACGPLVDFSSGNVIIFSVKVERVYQQTVTCSRVAGFVHVHKFMPEWLAKPSAHLGEGGGGGVQTPPSTNRGRRSGGGGAACPPMKILGWQTTYRFAPPPNNFDNLKKLW